MKLDSLDLGIIRELRKNSDVQIKTIATNLDRRRATIHARIKKLEENGVIKGQTIVLDFAKLDFPITVFLLVSLSQKMYQDANSMRAQSIKFAQMEYVTEVYSISGEYDYLLKIRIDNLDRLGEEVVFALRKYYGVDRTLTLTTFKTEKEELGNDEFEFLNLVLN